MIPRAHKDEDHDGISIQITKTNLILQVGKSNGFADATGYAILKYIKSEPQLTSMSMARPYVI